MTTHRLFLPCPAGVEELLAHEMRALLPQARAERRPGGVALCGDVLSVMRLNLESRLAQRVLIEIAQGPYRDEQDLYALAHGVDWRGWITPRETLRVDTTAQRSPLKSLNFASLRIKDGLCDALREATGERPSVDTRDPVLPLVLHLDAQRATLYADSSGEPLFKRGWRAEAGDAPLKETLAAALLAAAGWRGTPDTGGALHDPCCGSGTIAIEAAQIACGVAPGLARRFAFERWARFATPASREAWRRLKADASARVHASAVPIHASDVSFRMVDYARRNAARAGVAHAIEFHGGDALERAAPRLPASMAGTLIVNPPYGERVEVRGKAGTPHEQRGAPEDFFVRLAAHWKRGYTARDTRWTAWVLSPDLVLPQRMRLQESRRVPLWNGPIECRLYRFDLVAGSMRGRSATANG